MLSLLRSYLVVAPLIGLSTIFFGALGIVVSLFESDGRKQIGVARLWARSLLWAAGLDVEIEGLENIACDSSYVFASNHLSYMDTPVVLTHIPVQFRFLAKKGLFQIPFLGTHLVRAGHIPVPREDARAAVRTLSLAADAIRRLGVSLLVFPEGGRSHTGELGLFKEGAAYLAIKAGVPVVPICVIGTRQVLPFGSGHFHRGPVRLRIGEPISTNGLTLRDRGLLTSKIRAEIVAVLDRQTSGRSLPK
ncbi:MAG TPA: lysophospholipid acyltransferase family protein [Bryobacteraceae bacterium]|nr:lysophospholipid acyltransferase family protein [Bryobacteraceae bacterium]